MKNLQQYIDSKKTAKAAKKAEKKAKMEFFKDSTSTALWNRIQKEETEFADLIRNKGLNTIRALRFHEEVSEDDAFMTLMHKSSIILGFDITECSFFTEYDRKPGTDDNDFDYITIPSWIKQLFDSNYGYYKQTKPDRLIADFTDVTDHERRAYDEDAFTGHVVYNKELGAGMIFFSLEDGVNDDEVCFIKTK